VKTTPEAPAVQRRRRKRSVALFSANFVGKTILCCRSGVPSDARRHVQKLDRLKKCLSTVKKWSNFSCIPSFRRDQPCWSGQKWASPHIVIDAAHFGFSGFVR
jgi:hypothetical protein